MFACGVDIEVFTIWSPPPELIAFSVLTFYCFCRNWIGLLESLFWYLRFSKGSSLEHHLPIVILNFSASPRRFIHNPILPDFAWEVSSKYNFSYSDNILSLLLLHGVQSSLRRIVAEMWASSCTSDPIFFFGSIHFSIKWRVFRFRVHAA